MLPEEQEKFLQIENIAQLEKFLSKYYFNEKEDEKVKDCIKLYTSSVQELKKLYKYEFGKTPAFNLSNKLKLQNTLKDTEKYKDCDANTFKKLCRDKITENITEEELTEWLQKNGGYEKVINPPHKVLVEDFFNRLNTFTYYKSVFVENKVCGLDLSPFREKVPTIIRGIYANVLSVTKILNMGGLELLDNIVYCISEQFGMSNLQLNEDGTIQLREIDKSHQIKKTINIHDEEKLVLFEWNKSIIFCEGFQIIEIIPGNNANNFTVIPEGLYNYILVCFDMGSEKKYRLYLAESQPLEIGSKHWNIMAKVNDDLLAEKENQDTNVVIITAGEMDISEMELLFNFFSGTIFTKILKGECEIITGLNYDESSDDFCHSTVYEYFLAPYMKKFLKSCHSNEDFTFDYTPEHLIETKTLTEKGLIFDQSYYEKLQGMEGNSPECNIPGIQELK